MMRWAVLLLVLLLSTPAWAQIPPTSNPIIGLWDTTKTYQANQLVRYGGGIFICVAGGGPTCAMGDFPSNGVTWNALAGLKQWTTGVTYQPGQMVMQNSNLFTAVVANNSSDPAGGMNPNWATGSIPSTPTFTTETLTGGKFPPAMKLTAMTPGPGGSNASISFGSFGPGNLPLIEFIDDTPAAYGPGVPGSSGFIIYGHPTTGSGQNNPVSIFMDGNYWSGSNQSAQMEIANKANFDGDGKSQLWLEIPAGTPTMKVRNINADGRFAINSNGQLTSGIELSANVSGVYTPQITIEDATPGYVTFPQLTGGGNASLCVNAAGRVFRGTPGC